MLSKLAITGRRRLISDSKGLSESGLELVMDIISNESEYAAASIRVEENLDATVSVVPLSENSDPEVEAEPDLDVEPEGEGEEEDVDMLDRTMASEDVDLPPEVANNGWASPLHDASHSISFTSFQLNEAYPRLPISGSDESLNTIHETSKIATTKRILRECEIEYSIIPSPKPESAEYAATLSRLEADKMSDRETQQFPVLAQADLEVRQQYLSIRNNILLQWNTNPKQELTCEMACANIKVNSEVSEDLPSPERIYGLMNRICAINYGVYQMLNPVKALPHKVVVIGAGMAGLTAARKLKEFGFEVVVVEARDRPGGRVETWRSKDGKSHAEKGAMIVTGIVGNPLYTILHQQLNLNLVRIAGRCPLFTARHSVPKAIDEVLEVEFNSLLTAASGYGKLVKPPSASSSDQRVVSLGEALDVLLRREELKCLQQYREHKENRVDMMKALTKCYEDRKNLHLTWQKHAEEYRKAKGELTASDTGNTQWSYHLARARLVSSANRVDEISGRISQFDKLLQASSKAPPPKEYLTPEGRSIIGWHEANLEFANANHLNCLSLQHWDQDDEFELQGGHFSLEVGMDVLPKAMSEGLDVRYGQLVREVDVTGNKALVGLVDVSTGTMERIEGDSVLCTVPLGVLKDAVKQQLHRVGDTSAPARSKQIVGSVPVHTKYAMEFKPSLPLPLAQTIATMGFGTLNKVILSYKTRFWDVKRALFGFVNDDIRRRGEFFLFWSLYDTPTLVALVAGEAAVALESGFESGETGFEDGDVVKACHNTLRKIFGKDIEEPVESSVTHWGGDPFCQGSYSSVAPGASGNSYDVMATPLFDSKHPRLFFAGEHTIKNYPATLHGALLSGVREATKIADAFDPLS